ncbi:hypothetical protein NY486_09760, partial [Enterobacter hormaechei]|nr:hypothetical protein [Enterobacter hormaechei]
MYVNEVEELRESLARAQEEIAYLKDDLRRTQEDDEVDEFGTRTPAHGVDDDTLKASRGGRSVGRGRRGGRGGRGIATSITRKLGFPRASSGLSTGSADQSFNSG